MELQYTKVRDVKSPMRGTPGSAGIDFYLPESIGETASGNNCYVIGDNAILVGQGGSVKIPSGIHLRLPDNYSMTLKFDKSGIAFKKTLIHGANLIDEDYQGEFNFHLINVGIESTIIMGGEKIAQGVLIKTNSHCKIVSVDSLGMLYNGKISERGIGGFGSTNKS